jgi:hypothetical protein
MCDPAQRRRQECLRLALVLPLALLSSSAIVCAQEHGRIKKRAPSVTEAERNISEGVMNDGTLQKGDVVVTDRGFFLYRGLAPDGITYDFAPVPNPLSSKPQGQAK